MLCNLKVRHRLPDPEETGSDVTRSQTGCCHHNSEEAAEAQNVSAAFQQESGVCVRTYVFVCVCVHVRAMVVVGQASSKFSGLVEMTGLNDSFF